MRKTGAIFPLAAMIAMAAFLWGASAEAMELTAAERNFIKNQKEIVFVSQSAYPPFEFVDKEGRQDGMCHELVHWMAAELGFKAHFIHTTFKKAQEAVLNGRADVLTSFFYSKKRDRLFDFTPVMFLVPATIFVSVDRPDIRSLNDLNGKRIACQAGDYALEFLKENDINFTPLLTKSFAEATDMVIAGKADAVIGDEQIVLYHVYSHGLRERIKKVGQPLYVGKNCMGIKEGRKALLGILTKGIELARSTGVLDRINRKWLGERLAAPQESFLVRHKNTIIILGVMLAVIGLLAWAWIFNLRREVSKRTRELAESENRFSTVLSNAPIGVGFLHDGLISWHNQAMTRMLGFTPGELKGRHPRMLYSDQAYEKFKQQINNSGTRGEAMPVETQWRRKNGELFDCLLRHVPLEMEGEQRFSVVLAEDISQRKQAERALAEERNMFIAGPTMVFKWRAEPGWPVDYASENVLQLLGYSAKELMEGNPSFESLIHRDDLSVMLEEVERHTQAGIDRFEHQPYRLRCKDGRYLWVADYTNVLRDSIGKVTHYLGYVVDITRQHESEERLDLALKGTQAGWWDWQVPTGKAVFNERWAEMVGYTLDELAPLSIQTWRNLCQPDDLKRSEALVQEHFAGVTDAYQCEIRMRHKNGSWVWVLDSGKVVEWDDDGKPFRMTGTHFDITERKQIEEAKRISEERLNASLEAIDEGFVIYGPDDRLVMCNAKYKKLYPLIADLLEPGAEFETLVRTAVNRGQFPAAKGREKEWIQERISTHWKGDFTGVHRTAEGRWIKVAERRTSDGSTVSFRADITDLKNSEEALQASEERLQAALEAIDEGFVIYGPDDRMVMCNARYQEIYRESADVLGPGKSFEEIIREGVRRGQYSEAVGREEEWVAERMALHREGNSNLEQKLSDGRWVRISERRTSDGSIVGVREDITARKRAEEEKERLDASLRHAQKLQAVGTLAGGIAHEFNNLLAAIMGYSELIQDSAKGRDDILADASQIMRAGERGREMVRQLLAFSRKIEPQAKPLDLNSEILNSKEMLTRLIPRTISFETELAPDLNNVSMAASHLHQILMNLTTNAYHAMPEGGQLRIKTENVWVDQIFCPSCGKQFSGDYVLLSVRDTGQGMNAESVRRIFEPFFSTKEVGSGTGLGLSVVHGLINGYKGHITCDSEEGKGTVFTIYLPVYRADKKPPPAEVPPEPDLAVGHETILLVDDEEPLRLIGQRYISKAGYSVLLAGSGEDALELFRQHPGVIDLVILDLGMPGMGGHKALEEMLAMDPEIKVVIATGYASNDQVKRAKSTGAAAFVAKPFKKADLLATVRKVLDEK